MTMSTFLVLSSTNYGEVVHVVNAEDEDDVRNIVLNNDGVWDGNKIQMVDTNTRGIAAVVGGDCWGALLLSSNTALRTNFKITPLSAVSNDLRRLAYKVHELNTECGQE